MTLIVGLGNPGKRYEQTRHNVGFMVVDAFAAGSKEQRAESKWKWDKRSNAQVFKTTISNKTILVAKPQTFMNNSGSSVQSIIQSYKIQPTSYKLIVVHDDIDLPLGTIRVSHNASSAGHKGVESIIKHLGTKEFWRIRIGIKSESREQTVGSSVETPEFVLKRFSKDERKALPTIIDQSVDLLQRMVGGELKAQTVHCLP